MIFFFAMSHGVHRGVLKSGKADERYKLLDKINKNKNLITDFYGFNNIQPIWADEFLIKISNSKMGLNLSRGKPVKYYSSDRIAQYMGNGLATLIDEGTQYQDFFDKDELIFYKNTNDLVNKILQYKHDEKSRIKIAIKGSKKYRKYFNSTIVADFIIKKSMNVKSRLKYLWHQK
jgi:spore maturation protein CgeB